MLRFFVGGGEKQAVHANKKSFFIKDSQKHKFKKQTNAYKILPPLI